MTDGERRSIDHDAETLSPRSGDKATIPVSRSTTTRMPREIGSFKIRHVLGSGGMGTVYLARQEQPRRTVALKVMRADMTSPSALRRFEYEAQLLARLNHPNIADVYEAGIHGEDDAAVPYFAMEYVPNAKPITDFVREHRLSSQERLQLFAKVCDAIYHGHQKGIIHRDLKPANILVDSHGEPRVIDFGVARATDADMTVTTHQTNVGQLIGTLQYMSPEQCEADPHDLDTRSDVYALGILLYELLCEKLPYDVTQVAIHEAARVIREQEPPKPSTINRTLRGDLEIITLKALEKDRKRRYPSAGDLMRDIDRYLRSEPIEAHRPSLIYQLSKFARKHKAPFATAAGVFLALLVGLIATTVAMRQAQAARDVAQDERDRATRMFEEGHTLAKTVMKDVYLGIAEFPGTLPTRQLLVDASRNYLENIEAEVDDDFELRVDIAMAHRRIGQMLGGVRDPSAGDADEAMEHYGIALEINKELAEIDADHRENRRGLAVGHLFTGDVYYSDGEFEQAGRHYRESLEITDGLLGDADADAEDRRLVAAATLKVGDVLVQQEAFDEAAEQFERSLELREERMLEPPIDDEALRDLTVVHTRLGNLRKQRGELEAALRHYEKLLTTREDLLDRVPASTRRRRDVMLAEQYIAGVLSRLDRHEDAVEHYDRAVGLAETLVTCDPDDRQGAEDRAGAIFRHGYALVQAGRPAEALPILRRSLAEYEDLASSLQGSERFKATAKSIRSFISGLEDGQ